MLVLVLVAVLVAVMLMAWGAWMWCRSRCSRVSRIGTCAHRSTRAHTSSGCLRTHTRTVRHLFCVSLCPLCCRGCGCARASTATRM